MYSKENNRWEEYLENISNAASDKDSHVPLPSG